MKHTAILPVIFTVSWLIPVDAAALDQPAIPGFTLRDGRYVPNEPFLSGAEQVTGLQLPFPKMPSLANNPVTPEKVELGKLLFFDPILSGPNALSCATCHHPDFGFADGRPLAMGVGARGHGPDREGGIELRRGTPTLWNAAYNHLQFWDGRAADLEEQATIPIVDGKEMAQDPKELVEELLEFPEYVEMFQKAFGGTAETAVTFENTAKAIAAFERTLLTFNSRYDRYTQGDSTALSESEKRGMRLFHSVKTRCFECHRPPHFSDDTFRVIGAPQRAGHPEDAGRAEVPGQGPRFAFKVPTLRNIELTAPYMHNGTFKTLREVIDFYSTGGGRQFPNPTPDIDEKIGAFGLGYQEREDILAFLLSLTDTSLQPNPPERVPSGLPVVAVNTRASSPIPEVTLAADESKEPSRRSYTIGSAVQAVFAAETTGDPASSGTGVTFVVRPGDSIQKAVDRAQAGDRIEVSPGIYHESVAIEVSGIALVGLEVKGERPVLDGRGEMADAVQLAGNDFVIENFEIRNYQGNGVLASKAKNVAFLDLTIDNAGLYGVYPVECDGVLVEGCVVSRISDAGIYVGQSRNIVVRNNEVFNNVAGIEIENSVNAIVSNNSAHHNTGGILVFVLPNNPSKVGDNCRVIGNRIWSNNHPNFGKPGSTVSHIPPGTGLIVMAADRTEVTQNWIADNDTYGIAVLNVQTGNPGLDLTHQLDIEPYSDQTRIAGNVYRNNGSRPDPAYTAVGAPGGDLFWDGTGEGNLWDEAGELKTYPENLLELASR